MEKIDLVEKVHFFACVNKREDSASCAPTIRIEDIREIKKWILTNGLNVICTATYCQGWCNTDGGVISIYPDCTLIKGVKTTEEIKELILSKINAKNL